MGISNQQRITDRKTAEEMIAAIKSMDNGERIQFLKYLFHHHFDSRFGEDRDIASQNQIEDALDRQLSEDEMLVMKIAYGNGYFTGGKDGMEKVLKRY